MVGVGPLLVGSAGCGARAEDSPPLATETNDVARISRVNPASDAELAVRAARLPNAGDAFVAASWGSRAVAHVLCTEAVSRVVDHFPGVVTDYHFETRAQIAGETPPALVTLPGGNAGGVIVDVAAAVLPAPNAHYIAFFATPRAGASKPGAALGFRALLPATTTGEVQIGERRFGLNEIHSAIQGAAQ